MNKTINIAMVVLLVWFSTFAMLGKDTANWGVLLHSIEACLFVVVLIEVKKEIIVINWLINTVIAYLCYRITVEMTFVFSPFLFKYLNNDTFLMLLISLTILFSLIFNRKKL